MNKPVGRVGLAAHYQLARPTAARNPEPRRRANNLPLAYTADPICFFPPCVLLADMTQGMWEIFQIWLERGTWILFLGLQPTKSQKRWWFFYRWLAAKTRVLFSSSLVRHAGISACGSSRCPSPLIHPIHVKDHNSHGTKVPCTCNLQPAPEAAVPFSCVPVPYLCGTVRLHVFCSSIAAQLWGPCSTAAGATQRTDTFAFFFRDEKWYPDLARCDGSCRISFSHTHTLSPSLCSPLA